MPGKNYKGDEVLMSPETGNWNVASDYSKLKIMKYLYLADQYETICAFGVEDFLDEIQLTYNPDFLRIRAFRRLVKTLTMLIDNSLFAIKNKKSSWGKEAQKKGEKDKRKTDRQVLEDFRIELNRIFKIIPMLFHVKKDNIKKTKELVMKKEEFDPILERVIEIKTLINEPLNRSDLLFLDREEFDPKSHKEDLLERIKNKG